MIHGGVEGREDWGRLLDASGSVEGAVGRFVFNLRPAVWQHVIIATDSHYTIELVVASGRNTSIGSCH